MITKREQHMHLLERMSGVTLLKVALTRRALVLTNTHIFTFGATVTKCRLQVHLLESSLVATFLPGTSDIITMQSHDWQIQIAPL